MKQHEAGAVGGGGGGAGDPNKDSWEKWTEETKAAIEFEEDPHRAALFDNPKLVYVGKKTWAALIVRFGTHLTHSVSTAADMRGSSLSRHSESPLVRLLD